MSEILQWEGTGGEPGGEAEREAGTEAGPGQTDGGRGGAVGVGGPDAGAEAGADAAPVAGGRAVPGEPGEAGDPAGAEPGWTLATVTDGRTAEGAEALALITVDRYVELVGAEDAFKRALGHAGRISDSDLRHAMSAIVEVGRAVCGALRSGDAGV